MQIKADKLDERMKRLVAMGISGLDIMHGELKMLMLEAEHQYTLAIEEEERTEEAIDSMERKYWEGQVDALTMLYGLTYDLSFEIDVVKQNLEDGH